MRIILKPLGIVVVVAAMGGLAFLAIGRGNTPATSAPAMAATPGATTPSKGGIIYDDELRNDWANFSWAKNEFADTSVVGTGRCIRVEPKKFEAVYFHHDPMALAGYDRFSFRIHGGDAGGQQLKVMAQTETNGKNEGGTEYALSPLAAKKWVTITVPLAKLGVANKPNIAGFWIQEATGQTLKPFYVDEVRLLKPGEGATDN